MKIKIIKITKVAGINTFLVNHGKVKKTKVAGINTFLVNHGKVKIEKIVQRLYARETIKIFLKKTLGMKYRVY